MVILNTVYVFYVKKMRLPYYSKLKKTTKHLYVIEMHVIFHNNAKDLILNLNLLKSFKKRQVTKRQLGGDL